MNRHGRSHCCERPVAAGRSFYRARQAEQLRSRQRQADRPQDLAADLDELPSRRRATERSGHGNTHARHPAGSPDEFGPRPARSERRRTVGRDRRGSEVVLLETDQLRDVGRWSRPGILGTALAIDSSGQRLASWNLQSDVLTVWNLPAATQNSTLRWPRRATASQGESMPGGQLLSSELIWSPNGKCLTAIDRRSGEEGRQSLVLWDTATGEPRLLATIPEDTDRGGACFTSDGEKLAYPMGAGVVRFWESATGKKLNECAPADAYYR